MMPVSINPQNISGSHAAASQIMFGAAVISAAAGTVKSTLATVDNVIGIAINDDVDTHTVDGFYAQYDQIPVITRGPCRAWISSAHASAENILAGDFLEVMVKDAGAYTRPMGVLAEMSAATGTGTGAVRELRSVARALDDATLFDVEPLSAELTAGSQTATLIAGDITNLDLSIGDYVAFEDLAGSGEINRVTGTTATTITLLIPSVATYAIADVVHKLVQVEVELI